MSDRVSNWVLHELPRRNRDLLSERLTVGEFVGELNASVLSSVPVPEQVDSTQACRSVVDFGLIGASMARHSQQCDRGLVDTPERCFDSLRVSSQGIRFLDYMHRLAERTGTGHPSRDAYASLVRWNLPAIEVRWQGQRFAHLGSAFDDGCVRTYTGNSGEVQFLLLLKRCEALEHAINALLQPIVAGEIDVDADDAIEAVGIATVLLHAVHQVILDFTTPDEHGKILFCTNHFLDILRQFAVHWRVGDVPPSGAQDVEFLKRDFFLGLDYPNYGVHVRRIFPALLDAEREDLVRAQSVTSLPSLLAVQAGIDIELLATGTPDILLKLAREFPWLADYYLLMRANAWVAASHLMLTKRFLFKPVRERERAGIQDNPLVSNWAGTTGMLEKLLESLARPRLHHRLRGFAQLPLLELTSLSATARPEPWEREALLATVQSRTMDFSHGSANKDRQSID